MGKSIESGCIVQILRAPLWPELVGTVATVLSRTPLKTYSVIQCIELPSENRWQIENDLIRAMMKKYKCNGYGASECNLRRIDDGDFDPAAESEDNPYTMSVPNVWAPTRQA